MKPMATWEHAGLVVSAAPLAWVVMAPTGLHGVHHVTVAAESAAAAKQLLAKLMQGIVKPGICAAYSEEAELNQEVRDLAAGKSAASGVNPSQAISIPNMDEKYLEDRVRAEPEMVKRTAAAQGQYAIRFRLDKSYRKVKRELDGTRRLRAGHRQVRGGTGGGTIGGAQSETAAAGRKSADRAHQTAECCNPARTASAWRARMPPGRRHRSTNAPTGSTVRPSRNSRPIACPCASPFPKRIT